MDLAGGKAREVSDREATPELPESPLRRQRQYPSMEIVATAERKVIESESAQSWIESWQNGELRDCRPHEGRRAIGRAARTKAEAKGARERTTLISPRSTNGHNLDLRQVRDGKELKESLEDRLSWRCRPAEVVHRTRRSRWRRHGQVDRDGDKQDGEADLQLWKDIIPKKNLWKSRNPVEMFYQG